MGTNFYWKTPKVESREIALPTGEKITVGSSSLNDMDPIIHIGKRSAAGLFCWDCDETLRKGGKSRVHVGRGSAFDGDFYKEWHAACPKCGKKPTEGGLESGAAAVELGFAKPSQKRPTGVQTCASFTWAQDPKKVQEVYAKRPDEKLIRDEYDRELTCRDFLEMIECNCPIIYKKIGTQFC